MENIRSSIRLTAILIALCFVFTGGDCFAQEVEGRIDEYLNALVKMGQFSGSVLVARDELATMILNDIPPRSVVDYREEWSEEDRRDFQAASWRYIEQQMKYEEGDAPAG